MPPWIPPSPSPRNPPVPPPPAPAGDPQARPRTHAGRHLHRQFAGGLPAAGATALPAGMANDRPPAAALAAGHDLREVAEDRLLLVAQFARAAAGGAGLPRGAALAPGAETDGAGIQPGKGKSEKHTS